MPVTATDAVLSTYSYRYRLALEVEANGQTHSAARVVEIVIQSRPSGSPHFPAQPEVKTFGEALAIDLGNNTVLVALLEGVLREATWEGRKGREWHGFSPSILLARLYGLKYEWRFAQNDALAALGKQRGVRELTALQLPTLVTFRDPADPNSMFVVDPENLGQSLGNDVRLKRATIEVTDAPPTTGIERQLPWLRTIKGGTSGKPTCTRAELMRPELPFCPHRSQFIQSR